MSIKNHVGKIIGGWKSVGGGTYAALVAACALSMNVASADETVVSPLTKVVTYQDLNLSQQAGVEVLYGRLQSAAREVCAPLNSRMLSNAVAWRACVAQALDRAVSDIHEPILAAYHTRKIGKSAGPVKVAND